MYTHAPKAHTTSLQGGTTPLGLIFEDRAFSQKIKQLWTKYPIRWIWSETFQGTQKHSLTSAETNVVKLQ